MSLLDQYITNPVCLRDIRQLHRLQWIKFFIGGVLCLSLFMPAGIYLYQSMFHPSKAFNPLVMFFACVCTQGGIFLVSWFHALGSGIGPSGNKTPQQEFVYHGKLELRTLLDGKRKSSWIILGTLHLATLPWMVLAWYLFPELAGHYLVFQCTMLILALCYIELGLSSTGLGLWALLISYFFILLLFGPLEEMHGKHLGLHFNEIFFGSEVPDKPQDLPNEQIKLGIAYLPWRDLLGVIIPWVMTLTCVIVGHRMTLQPRRTNREAPFRLILTATCAINFLLVGYLFWTSKDSSHLTESNEMILFFSCLIFSLMGLVAGWGEATGPLPQRVRREIPTTRWRRWLAFPFFYGPASRLTWCVGLIIACTIAVTVLNGVTTANGRELWNQKTDMMLIIGTALIVSTYYLQVAILIQNNPGANQEKLKRKILMFILIYLVGPIILIGIVGRLDGDKLVTSTFIDEICLPVGIVAFLIQALRCRKWFAERWREFQPAE